MSVDVLPFTVQHSQLQILLVKRGTEPFYGQWAIPGGFLGLAESAEEAARRSLSEETGVTEAYFEQLYTFSEPGRDPRSRVISIAYLALVPAERLSYRSGSSILEADLFQVKEENGSLSLARVSDQTPLPANVLAFDHEEIIRTAISRMRGKIWYTDIAFGLMNDPEGFTMPELLNSFEAILGVRLDPGNFYRKVKHDYEDTGKIEHTGDSTRTSGNRKVKLYRLVR